MKNLTYSDERGDDGQGGRLMSSEEELINSAEERMNTAEDRLRFVVEFASMDLDRLRPGDWMNLKDDLQAFLCLDQVVVEGRRPQDFSPDEFRALQQEVQQVLRELVQHREPSGHWPLANHTTPFRVQVAYQVTPLDRLGRPGRNMLGVRGPTREVFLVVLSHLLWQEATERIVQCPECGTIFYRNHKRRYCTRRCVDRVNQRSWRASKRQPA
jgi:hypothetical protein